MMKRIFIDLYTINALSFKQKVMDTGIVPGVEYVFEIFVFPSEWYRVNYGFSEEIIEKKAFRIRMDNIEQMDYVINQIYSDIRYISDLEAGPARVDENGGRKIYLV